MSGDESDFRVEQVEALARGLEQNALEDAIKRTLDKLAGVPREALEAVLRANESEAISRKLVLDATTLKTLPGETLDALASTLFDFAVETTPQDPEPAPPAVKEPSGNTTTAFTGDVWKPDASYPNSFRGFYELNGSLSREAFLSKFQAPFLVSSVTFDRATWSGALVLPVEKKNPNDADKQILVGRDPGCDLVIPHNSVSKQHVRFSFTDGRWCAVDLGSANGTRIDGVTIEPNKPVRLRDISKVDLGGGANLTFNTATGLYHFVEQIRKLENQMRKLDGESRRSAVEPEGKIELKPHSSAAKKTSDGAVKTAASATTPKGTNKFSFDKNPTPAPKARSSAPLPAQSGESAARVALGGIASLVGTPRRLALTIFMIALLSLSIARMGKPLALILFAESHPEWFESDLPAHLKNPGQQPPPPPPPPAKAPDPPKK